MKYIFRYALLTNFTEKDTLITKEQLIEALKTAKYQLNNRDLDNLVNKHSECITVLLKSADRRDWEGIVRDSFEKEELTDNDVSDLLNVWQNQKYLIYKKILNNNSKSSGSYQGIGWTVKNGIAGRRGTQANAPTIMLQIRDKSQTFESNLSRQQFSALSTKIHSATTFLSELFQNS